MTNILPAQGYFKDQERLNVLPEYLEGSKHLKTLATVITVYFLFLK